MEAVAVGERGKELSSSTTMNSPLTPIVMSNASRDTSERRAAAELRLEQMLAKAELLANEMRVAAHSSSASQPKGRRRNSVSSNPQQRDGSTRSLPKVIDLPPPDDTARSECSSLGLSLASTMIVPKSSSTPSPTENSVFMEPSDPLLIPENMCGVIREGSIYDGGDEKKSCDGSTVKDDPAKQGDQVLLTSRSTNNENVANSRTLATMMTPTQAILSTPRSVNQAADLIAEPAANISKAVLQDVPPTSHTKKSRASWEPRSTIVTEHDDDYVPIKDYSVPTHREPVNVKWEKVDTATAGDDDYVPLKDYSQFNKKKQSRLSNEMDDGVGLSYAARRAQWLRRKRKRRRQRRICLLILVVLSILGYFAYLLYKDWAKESVTGEIENFVVVDLKPVEVVSSVGEALDIVNDETVDSCDALQEGYEEMNETEVVLPLGRETSSLVISQNDLDLTVSSSNVEWNLLILLTLMGDKGERRGWLEELIDGMMQ